MSQSPAVENCLCQAWTHWNSRHSWSDFQSRFINYWCEAIADALTPRYEATLGERVYLVEHDPEMRKLGFPDVAITHDNLSSSTEPVLSPGTTTLEPVTIPLAILEGPRETYIEIVHQPDKSLVATLELLSPANKEQPGRTEYLAKRRAVIYQKVHVVELDLLLGGRRRRSRCRQRTIIILCRTAIDARIATSIAGRCATRYQPCPSRCARHPDPDILVDLGAVFATAYARARFYRRIDYQGPIPPVVSKQDQASVESVVRNSNPGSS